MLPIRADDFRTVSETLRAFMRSAPAVRTERWQGVDVSKDPSATTYELSHVVLEVPLKGIEDLDHWRADIAPNLPWADDHFLERVGGEPLNPGKEWANWPWASSADRFRNADAIFNHSYAERLWPKYPRVTEGGVLSLYDKGEGGATFERKVPNEHRPPMYGIGWEYGDLQDLVELLAGEPYTRQAWIPLFFPEDTGVGDGGRKPCTLGYQFIVRNDKDGVPCLNIWYPLRSCDLVRHFRDDVYLAVRLLLWVLERCRARRPDFWDSVKPGWYGMHCTSLHVFENDRRTL